MTSLQAFPTPSFFTSPQDALQQCMEFTNYHYKTHVALQLTFIERAYEFYRAVIIHQFAFFAVSAHADNQYNQIPNRPRPVTFRQFVAQLDPNVKNEYRKQKKALTQCNMN